MCHIAGKIESFFQVISTTSHLSFFLSPTYYRWPSTLATHPIFIFIFLLTDYHHFSLPQTVHVQLINGSILASIMIPGDMAAYFPVESLFQTHDDSRLPSTTPSAPRAAQDFHGVLSNGMMVRRSMSFSGVDVSDQEVHMDDDISEDSGPLGEKKKRLSFEQVKALEKSFELGNKLEPERKMQLAKAIGLQPRQVAIWFQNRRARWKTKQMEKDFEVLKRQLDLLKADNEVLRAQNKQFHSELMALQSRESNGLGPIINLNKENEASWSNGSESSVDVNLGITGTTSIESGLKSNPNPSNKHVFTARMEQPISVTHLHQGSVRADLQCPRIDQPTTADGGLCNMFNSVEEQPSFWPWPEQSNFR